MTKTIKKEEEEGESYFEDFKGGSPTITSSSSSSTTITDDLLFNERGEGGGDDDLVLVEEVSEGGFSANSGTVSGGNDATACARYCWSWKGTTIIIDNGDNQPLDLVNKLYNCPNNIRTDKMLNDPLPTSFSEKKQQKR